MPRLSFTPVQKIAIGYLLLAVLGAFALMLPISHHIHVKFIDALFTSASASYVTGLSTVNTATTWTTIGDVIIALLIQIGGSGITLVTTLVYLLLGRKIRIGERIFIAEDKNFHVNGIVRLIKSILFYSLSIEGASSFILALYFRFHYAYSWPRAIGISIFHSVSAFNNAGFDLWGNSLEGFQHDPLVLLITSALIMLGGLGFVVLTEIHSYAHTRNFSLHSRIVIKMTTILIISGTLLTLFFEANTSMAHLDWFDKITNSFFTSVTLRTAGFDSIPISSMRDVTWFIFIIFMFIGASPGSTGGGIKTTTFYMLVKSAISNISGRSEIISGERSIPIDLAIRSMVIFMLSTSVIMVATLVNVVFEPKISFLRLLFEEVSAFGTVGLTTGITEIINSPMKWVLIFTMYLGRIGVFTFLVSLSQRKRTTVSYLQEKIMIG
jgi:trk system potassium uptake protein TrkH